MSRCRSRPRFPVCHAVAHDVPDHTQLAACGPRLARVTIAVILPVSTVVWLSTVLSVGCIGAGILIGGLVADRIEKLVSAEVGRDQQRQP